MAGWAVSQLIRNWGWLAKLGLGGEAGLEARDGARDRSGSGAALNALCMQWLLPAISKHFERGFLGIPEAFFVIG